jgi:glyoxylase-like metal-dependent hydrolase (beta-lactamase superfamily II)
MAVLSPVLLRAHNASAWTGPTGNNTWLIRGRVPVLIDAGVGDAAHLRELAGALGGVPLWAVLITHGHVDHASGAEAIRQRWPSVRVRPASQPFADGEVIPAGDGALRAVHTPGHAPDHWCFLDEASRDLYCGDLARVGGTIVIPARRGGDLRRYLESLQRILELAPARLLPGHGAIVDRPADLIREYLAHRAAREREIVAALDDGASTPEAIVDRVYAGLPAALHGAAAESVLAHLIKLRDDGRAVEEGGLWALGFGL